MQAGKTQLFSLHFKWTAVTINSINFCILAETNLQVHSLEKEREKKSPHKQIFLIITLGGLLSYNYKSDSNYSNFKFYLKPVFVCKQTAQLTIKKCSFFHNISPGIATMCHLFYFKVEMAVSNSRHRPPLPVFGMHSASRYKVCYTDSLRVIQ